MKEAEIQLKSQIELVDKKVKSKFVDLLKSGPWFRLP